MQVNLGVFNDKKEEEQFALESVDDIFKYADQLKAVIELHRVNENVVVAS
jgi:predicted type IV restriction endonuclease